MFSFVTHLPVSAVTVECPNRYPRSTQKGFIIDDAIQWIYTIFKIPKIPIFHEGMLSDKLV